MADPPLVISTRAAPGHGSMAEALRAAGHDVLACPLQRREAIDEAALARDFDALSPVDLVVVTSPQAAEVACRALGPARLRSSVLVAPGPGTARVLQQHELTPEFPERGGTSEHVLALEALAAPRVRGRRAVLLAAPGGRTLIARTLTARGVDVHFLAPYHRVAVPPDPALADALSTKRPIVTLLSSAAALDALHDALPESLRPRWLSAGFVVSSQRLADRLHALGAPRVRVADGAAEAAFIDALAAWEA